MPPVSETGAQPEFFGGVGGPGRAAKRAIASNGEPDRVDLGVGHGFVDETRPIGATRDGTSLGSSPRALLRLMTW